MFSIDTMNRKISSLKRLELGKPIVGPVKSDVTITHIVQSYDRHSDFNAQDLSERWVISISTAANTLKNTTQKFLRISVLYLSRRCRTDRVFIRKAFRGYWSTDTINSRCYSLEGNRHVKLFATKALFSRIYPVDSKKKAGDALRLFCH